MRTLTLFLLASASCFAVCPTGSTVLTSTQAGNASSAATWGGTALGAGDGKCLQIGHAVVFNQDLGTSGGAGLKGAYVNAGGSISWDTSAARNVYMGSTGSDPCGSGSSAAPGANATMFGFYLSGSGMNSFVGTQANPLTFYSGTYPSYINARGGTASVTLKWAHTVQFGTSTVCSGDGLAYFTGVSAYDANLGPFTVDIENTWSDAPYEVFSASGGYNYLSVTLANNKITGRTGPYSFGNIYSLASVTSTSNTELSPATNGFMEAWQNVATYATSGNAGAGAGSVGLGGLNLTGGTGSVSGWLIWNDPTQAGNYSPFADAIEMPALGQTVSGVFCENCNHTIIFSSNLLGAATRGTGNVALTNHRAANGQGFFYGQGGNVVYDHNLAVLTDAPTTGNAVPIDVYTAGGNGLANEVAYSNTIVSLFPQTSALQSQALQFADSGSSGMPACRANNNLISGFWNAIVETALALPSDTFVTTGTGGVGVYANATYSPGVPYLYQAGFKPANWDNGTTAHPSATYGDVDGIDPSFLDTSRNMEIYDARVLGGPGTALDFVTRLSYRSGWGGTYTLGATPIADAIAWIQKGFVPGNSAMCPGGVVYGLMPCLTAATAVVRQ